MNNTGMYIRLTKAEKDYLKQQGGKNVTKWIKERLFPKTFRVSIDPEIKESMIKAEESIAYMGAKCVSCHSYDTLPYIRRGTTFYLCNMHKP